jgi:hypothetical protein
MKVCNFSLWPWGPITAVHELSHHIDYTDSLGTALGISETDDYLKLSGWQKKKRYKTNNKTGKKMLVS